MANLLRRRPRWALVSGLLLLVVLLGLERGLVFKAQPISSRAVLPAEAADEFDEPNGLIAQRSLGAAPAAAPQSPSQLIQAELHPAKAVLPSGPVTYVPILLYHYVRVNPNPRDTVGYSLSTTPAAFRQQMQYLADHGFHVISLHQAVGAIKAHSPLPSHSVVLTFDDGYADFFTTAIPIMQSHGFTATDFVISGRMGMWSFMTPNQVVAADAMGFTIGAHTVDHVALAAQSSSRAAWEIRTSKSMLETLLGHPVIEFAYPYGSFNGYDEAQAKSAGFETAVSTLYGTLHTPGQLFYLSRMRIGGGLSLGYFARVVGGPPPTAAELQAAPTPASPVTIKPTPTPSPRPTTSPSAKSTAALAPRTWFSLA